MAIRAATRAYPANGAEYVVAALNGAGVVGYQVVQSRIKERYRPMPNAAERRHHILVMQRNCEACGASYGIIAHHLLQDAPGKRFRRDHELVVPLCAPCHTDLHDKTGCEKTFGAANYFDLVEVAVRLRDESKRMGVI